MAAAIFSAFFLGQQVFSRSAPSDRIPADAKQQFGLMAEAWNTIQAHYVDRSAVKQTPLTYGAIRGMVDALGDVDHSTFLSPDEIKQEEDFTKGRYKGIGVVVKMKDGHVTIVTPLDGSPAQKAGLKPGDVILAVNGESIANLDLFQVVKLIAGPVDTEVSLRILNPSSGETRPVVLKRAEITPQNVTIYRFPGTRIDHVRITAFSENVTKNLKKVLEQVQKENSAGIILDLRNNPGGLLKMPSRPPVSS